MKLSAKLAALKKQQQTKAAESRAGRRPRGKIFAWSWCLPVLVLLVAAGGTLGVLEFFIWNKVPPALVGTWDVEPGQQFGGSFTFSRTGNLVVHLKDKTGSFDLQSRAVVDGRNLQTTNYNPQTRREESHTGTILELTAESLILELENGDVVRMVRRK
jgi:hypothetical protein